MRLRVQRAAQAASLLLSPGDGHWCRVDAIDGAPDDGPGPVVLTGPQSERVGGLLDLRRGAPIDLYATPAVFEHLTLALPLLPVLQQFCGVQWHLIPVAGERHSADFAVDGAPSLVFTALNDGDASIGERVALAVRDERTGARLFVVHGDSLDGPSFDALHDWMKDADCVVIDRVPALPSARWLDHVALVGNARKLLLEANGTDRALLAACGIECADRAMEFEV
jgi:pyrroloquinoline quinone biosynthesis protein B